MAQMTATPVGTQGFFVDGKWIEDGDPVEVRAPYDGSVIASVFQGRREHAEAAIAAAVKAFGTTRRLPAFERQRVLRRVSENISERKQEFARTMAQESGKPIKAARTEKCCLDQHLAALLVDGTAGRDEDELSARVRRLAGRRFCDIDGPAGDVGGEEPEPVRTFRGSVGHVWGRTVLTSSSRARMTSASSESTWTTAA